MAKNKTKKTQPTTETEKPVMHDKCPHCLEPLKEPMAPGSVCPKCKRHL